MGAKVRYHQRIVDDGSNFEELWHAIQKSMAQPVPCFALVAKSPEAETRVSPRPAMFAIALPALLALALTLALTVEANAQIVAAPAAQSSTKPREASIDEYRAHLQTLAALVQACAKARDMKTCDPTQVGPDDLVPDLQAQNAPRRLIRYGWLRVLLSKAEDKDAPPPTVKPASTRESQSWENVRPIPRTTTELLQDAQIRLTRDLDQAISPSTPIANHDQERAVMKQVLAGREFSGLEETTPQDSVMEKAGNWLNHVLESAMRASARAPWLGRALVWSFVTVVCAGLVWGLWRLERRWRSRLISEDGKPAPGAASAVSWQIWLENARRAAAAQQWREAIHLLYWAAISRLESKRLWPADRARTPREYLALVPSEDARQPSLATLTGSFERVWYGGRLAAESDYRRAEQLASALIYGPGHGLGTAEGAAPSSSSRGASE